MSRHADPVKRMIHGFTARFEDNGHDITAIAIQAATPGVSRLRCVLCEQEVSIEIRWGGNWTLLSRTLDWPCKGRIDRG